MDLDKFGEIIDNFLKENRVQMLIEIPEGTLEPTVEDNIGAGPVMKFYFLLKSISAVGKELKKEMGYDNTGDWEYVVDEILKLVKDELVEEKQDEV